MTPLEKELARKLAWAVISTLNPPANLKYRVRAWAWRLACKMVDSKQQFRVDNPSPPPDNGMAGGGVAGVSKGRSFPMRNPGHPAAQEGRHASVASTGSDDVRGGQSGELRGQTDRSEACPYSGCRWWSGARCVRRPAGSEYRWRWDEAPETSETGPHGRRHADGFDYRECYLEKGS